MTVPVPTSGLASAETQSSEHETGGIKQCMAECYEFVALYLQGVSVSSESMERRGFDVRLFQLLHVCVMFSEIVCTMCGTSALVSETLQWEPAGHHTTLCEFSSLVCGWVF